MTEQSKITFQREPFYDELGKAISRQEVLNNPNDVHESALRHNPHTEAFSYVLYESHIRQHDVPTIFRDCDSSIHMKYIYSALSALYETVFSRVCHSIAFFQVLLQLVLDAFENILDNTLYGTFYRENNALAYYKNPQSIYSFRTCNTYGSLSVILSCNSFR